MATAINNPKPVKAKRSLTKAGHKRVTIHIPDESWKLIQAHIDSNCLDESKWLTAQMKKLASDLRQAE